MDMQREILAELEVVDAERARRTGVAGLSERVVSLKAYQQLRFGRTYADLLASDRYGQAARFFLSDLYGPRDFAGRDAQFARIVPALVRLFPGDVVTLVLRLAKLHALSEGLDTEMALQLGGDARAWSAGAYVAAWAAVGREDDRRRQVAWTLEIGRGLDRLVGKPLLVRTLRLMRGPAQLAGLADLQAFLERGLEAFRAMRGASEFLRIIDQREEVLIRLLFAGRAGGSGALESDSGTGGWESEVLGQLP